MRKSYDPTNELRLSEDHLRLVIDTIPQQIWSGPSDGTLDFCNAQWRSYMGISLEELQGEGWQTMLHPEDRQRVLKAWRESVATGALYEQEERHRRADGEYRWFLSRGVPFRDSEGRIVRWYGTNTDIHERKRAREALQEAQENLAHVSRTVMMGELVASIAHEIYQPLTGVITTGNFIKRQVTGGTPNLAELKDAVTEMVDDANRIHTVISRIRSLFTRNAPDRVELDINDVIQEVIVLVRTEVVRNSVQFRLDLSTGLPHVLGDRVLLQQVLINLIMNAIDSMRNVTDRPRNVDIESVKHASGVSIRVRDSGTGFDPKVLERIFQPFFTTKPQGLGMGLAISRSVIESHGGQLCAEKCSSGAIFQFTLPIDGARAEGLRWVLEPDF
jgi:PAS domain S-box-containing protein